MHYLETTASCSHRRVKHSKITLDALLWDRESFLVKGIGQTDRAVDKAVMDCGAG